MTTGFQKVVLSQPAPGTEGDFASTNPRASIPPVIGGAWKVAAAQSVRVGYFAWGAADGQVYSSLAAATAIAANPVLGFVARQPNKPSVMIVLFLGETAQLLQVGRECTLMSIGDYWANLVGITMGATIYADAATGAPTLNAAAGANPDTSYRGSSVSKVNAVTNAATTIAAQTGIMTVAVVASGVIEVGQRITGGTTPANTYVTAQLTGAAGGAGTYQTSSINRAAVAAFTATLIQGGLAKISRLVA